ncbi:hypothetical protein DPEC_G00346260 [Dallia pectoralis]|uniref:Uncharacterized protein n=1 Tax=Dallia pectoralis TaxID=75939 RepID=A0ACC2F3Z9_DALPE|nr:hypothetical protein DPEC_G00346260 [Dallia pectoralis]
MSRKASQNGPQEHPACSRFFWVKAGLIPQSSLHRPIHQSPRQSGGAAGSVIDSSQPLNMCQAHTRRSISLPLGASQPRPSRTATHPPGGKK